MSEGLVPQRDMHGYFKVALIIVIAVLAFAGGLLLGWAARGWWG